MARRRESLAWGVRRDARTPVRRRFSTTPPIDPLTVEYWDADYGITLVGGPFADVWTGQLAGITVPAAAAGNRMNYLTDTWNGKTVNVVQGVAGSRGLRNAALGSPIATTGQRPWMLSAYRLYNAMPGSALWGIFAIGVNATSDPQYTLYQTFGGNVFRPGVLGVNVSATAAADTLIHVAETWADGTNSNVRDNGVLSQVPNTLALTANMTAIGIGAAASGNTHFGDCNHAFHMLCSAKPSDSYIAELKAWLNYWKGTPL